MIERFVQALKAKDPHTTAQTGGYSGWVKFIMDGKAGTTSSNLWYMHGSGGGGHVTRGVIQTNRQQVYLNNADIVWNGHTHDSWQVPIQTIELTQKMTVKQGRTLHVRTAGYKDEYVDGYGGWHIERGAPPKPLGCAVLEFFLTIDPITKGRRMACDARELWR